MSRTSIITRLTSSSQSSHSGAGVKPAEYKPPAFAGGFDILFFIFLVWM